MKTTFCSIIRRGVARNVSTAALAIVLAMSATTLRAQVRIGGLSSPHGSAILDLNVDNTTDHGTQGLALPRVALTATNVAAPVASPIKGLQVYNTATAGSGTTAVSPGVYFWDGTKWVAPAEVDGVIGNEVADATNTTLVRSGSGTTGAPYTLARAEITGDVKIPAGSNTATIQPDAVTSAKIKDGEIVFADMADAAITASNGLTESPKNNIKLGGTLSENTTIAHGSYTLTHSGTGKEIISTPLQYNYSGASPGADKVLTSDASGNATWTTKTAKAHSGTVSSSDVIIGRSIPGMTYTGFYVDVPAGLSTVSFGCLVLNSIAAGTFATFGLSTSSSSYTGASSMITPQLVAFTLAPGDGVRSGGQCIWYLNMDVAKRIYVWGCVDAAPTATIQVINKVETFIYCAY
jgi:hypothetical protein